jgi:hypothetical protein
MNHVKVNCRASNFKAFTRKANETRSGGLMPAIRVITH